MEILRSKKPGPAFSFESKLYTYSQISIFIRNQSVKVDYSHSIPIASSIQNNIIFNSLFVDMLEKPYSNCRSHVSFGLNHTRQFTYKKNEW